MNFDEFRRVWAKDLAIEHKQWTGAAGDPYVKNEAFASVFTAASSDVLPVSHHLHADVGV